MPRFALPVSVLSSLLVFPPFPLVSALTILVSPLFLPFPLPLPPFDAQLAVSRLAMAVTNETAMPSDAELTVQEIALSTPYLKAVAVYMHRACEDKIRVGRASAKTSGFPDQAVSSPDRNPPGMHSFVWETRRFASFHVLR
jgi:hypothetical protein